MVLLPEEAEMTLAELRQMAARQQHQIEAQQQLLVAKEQRLKFLKQQEARHHSLNEHQLDGVFIQNLKEKVNTQDIKLRQLRALRAQVEQQKTNNGNLGAELGSIKALFSEKEKELNLAVNKVEELSRQLDEIRLNKNRKCNVSSTASELENIKRELLYRTKLSEQQNNYICQQRENIAQHQQNISLFDQKISDLTQRLHRKRLLNQQLASQMHNVNRNNVNNNLYHTSTIAAVEPLPREILEPEHTQDDIATKLHVSHKEDLNEFSVTKNDPKYQTLPYNTKFTLKGKNEDTFSSSTEDDSGPNSLDSSSSKKIQISNSQSQLRTDSNFTKAFNGNLGENNYKLLETEKDADQLKSMENNNLINARSEQNHHLEKLGNSRNPNSNKVFQKPVPLNNVSQENSKSKLTTSNQKPTVPPKPALPVKPMILNRQSTNSLKGKMSHEKDVDAALHVLQKRSSTNEKSIISNYRKRLLYYQCVSRLSSKDHVPQAPSKSKIATYSKKPLYQEIKHIENSDNSGNIKRKSSLGQLPIKPKPLTIRKTPGLEPPKLKAQTSVNGNSIRRLAESSIQMPYSKSSLNNSKESLSNTADVTTDVTISEIVPIKKLEDDAKKSDDLPTSNETTSIENKSEVPKVNVDEVDLVNSLNNISLITEALFVESDMEEAFPSASVRRLRKGNLKGENSIRNSRRVSFDPLALLLDAALEGELELVKKTAIEVPNLSAANDEGITALHNAICAGHFEVVRFLVEFGCDVNAQDSDGWTPLHCAASCNNLPMVKFLVEKGACVFATTFSDHETAAEKCEEDEEGFDGCSEFLISLQENLGVTNNGVVYAVYDYEVQNADELGFKDGDSLIVLRKGDDKESEWWWSRLQDAEGYVPRNLLGLHSRVPSKGQESPKSSDYSFLHIEQIS